MKTYYCAYCGTSSAAVPIRLIHAGMDTGCCEHCFTGEDDGPCWDDLPPADLLTRAEGLLGMFKTIKGVRHLSHHERDIESLSTQIRREGYEYWPARKK